MDYKNIASREIKWDVTVTRLEKGAEASDIHKLDSMQQALDTVDGGAWGGDEAVHAIDIKGYCVQLVGAAIKNSKYDVALAKVAEAHGLVP